MRARSSRVSLEFSSDISYEINLFISGLTRNFSELSESIQVVDFVQYFFIFFSSDVLCVGLVDFSCLYLSLTPDSTSTTTWDESLSQKNIIHIVYMKMKIKYSAVRGENTSSRLRILRIYGPCDHTDDSQKKPTSKQQRRMTTRKENLKNWKTISRFLHAPRRKDPENFCAKYFSAATQLRSYKSEILERLKVCERVWDIYFVCRLRGHLSSTSSFIWII